MNLLVTVFKRSWLLFSFSNSILVSLTNSLKAHLWLTVSPCPQGPAPSSESVGIPLCTFSRDSKSSTPLLLGLSVLGSFQSERFNQTGEKEDGESSFLSDSALRSAGFQEKRDFPFSSLQRVVSFVSSSLFFFPLPLCHPSPHVYPIFSSILALSLSLLFAILFPVGVVEGHSAHWLS